MIGASAFGIVLLFAMRALAAEGRPQAPSQQQDVGSRTLMEPGRVSATSFTSHIQAAIAEIELAKDWRKNEPNQHHAKALSELKAAYSAKDEPLLLYAMGILNFKLMEDKAAADLEQRFMLRYVEAPGVIPKDHVDLLIQALTGWSAWEEDLFGLRRRWMGWQPADTLAANQELVARCRKAVPLSREPDVLLLKKAQEQDRLPPIPAAEATELLFAEQAGQDFSPPFNVVEKDKSWSTAFKADDVARELEAAYKETGDPRILWHLGSENGRVADQTGSAGFNEKRNCYRGYYLSFVPSSGTRRDLLKWEESMARLTSVANLFKRIQPIEPSTAYLTALLTKE